MTVTYDIKESLAEYLIHRVIACASGSGDGEDGELCLFERPRDTYFIGSLSPQVQQNDEEDDPNTEFFARLAPHAMGLDLLVDTTEERVLDLQVNFNVYYRIFPSYDQQLKLPGQKTFAVAYRRVPVTIGPLKLSTGQVTEQGLIISPDHPAIGRALAKVRGQIQADPDVYCRNTVELPDDFDAQTFHEKVQEAKRGQPVVPEWRVELHSRLSPWDANTGLVSISLVNTSPDPDPTGKDKLVDVFIFGVRLSLGMDAKAARPFAFALLEDSYRFDRNMWGVGHNCNVEPAWERDRLVLHTTCAPVSKQPRFIPRRHLPTGDHLASLTFQELSADPEGVLSALLSNMYAYLEYWRTHGISEIWARTGYSESEVRRPFLENMSAFEQEIHRFRDGVRMLSDARYSDVRQAFILMNRVFDRLGSGKYTAWRPFQLVFMVSVMPDLVWQAMGGCEYASDPEAADVLWFPTGGGKTEAYLGLTVWALFFDRLRGKSAGTTAVYRFPLRLLSLQQFQRVLRTLAVAELVRREEGIPGEPFSVGHWVGQSQSPNEVRRPEDAERIREDLLDEKKQRRYRRAKDCPFCGTKDSITLKWDDDEWRLVHVCGEAGCPWFNKGLPLYIIDREIYRYLPSVVVSTLDKVALFGWNVRAANILGLVSHKCPVHGYSWNAKCDVDGCRESLVAVGDDDRALLRPSIQVQDELHLIKEDLGSFASHYEGFMTYVQEKEFGRSWKIIASTATIRDFRDHVRHVYARNARRFPVQGPLWDESFYTEKDGGRIGRYFVGVLPHNKTHINATVELLWYFHREIQDLRRLPGRESVRVVGTSLTDEEWEALLDDYEVSLTYCLTKRGGDQVAESIGSQIDEYLTRDGYEGILNEMFTGETTQDTIFEVMDELESRYKSRTPAERIRSITATSMISHGVDVDRFNFMVFFGMPRQTAEYIQASSRVGRASPGISLVCFAAARERDRSHARYFLKYHEYLERLVEAPAINRWSKFSIDKTIPGLFMGVLYSDYSRRTLKNFYLTRVVSQEVQTLRDEFPELCRTFKRMYAVDLEGGDYFTTRIPERLQQFIDAASESHRHSGFPQCLHPEPMRSLRDTDEPIPFVAARGGLPRSFLP